jgi:methylated-DNA-[protein]-cysteine S-methyltransferase
MIYFHIYETKIGKLRITEEEGKITGISTVTETDERTVSLDNVMACETKLLQEAYGQIREYLDGIRKDFALPLNPKGTEFQNRVWMKLKSIPYGETRSYLEIARACGNPNACRAVGMANHRNPIMIVIPCHRVIGVDGSLTGYGGGLALKEWLLHLEQHTSTTDKNASYE